MNLVANTNSRWMNRALQWKVEREYEEMGNDVEMHIVYPYGATLSLHHPAVPIVSSGVLAIPIHRPLG